MSSISAFVKECNEPGRLERMSGNDTRPGISAGVGPCAISLRDRFQHDRLYAQAPLLGTGPQDLEHRFGSSIVALMSNSFPWPAWFG
jgi:hypothetical protein